MPVVLFHVQHLLGIGHLMRARFVAEALADAGCEVHLVSGGRPFGGRLPRRVRMVQLPPIHADDPGMKPLRGDDGRAIDDAYRARRRDLLLAEFEAVAPDVVVFETFPFGRRALHFELLPLLERVEATRPRPLVVSSVRDILQAQRNPAREQDMLALAQRFFDAILVHGDSRFIRFEETFPLARELAMPVHYTGFVAGPGAEPPHSADDRRGAEVVVSAGGGAVGMHVLRAAIGAHRSSEVAGAPWRLLAGANVGDDDLRALMREAGPGAVVERAREDFSSLLARAAISVSQAGYNTVLDVMRSGARPVIVPYTEDGETEQRARALRLQELALAIVVDETPVSVAALEGAIDAARTRTTWGRWDFDCDGAARSATLIMETLAANRGRHGGTTS